MYYFSPEHGVHVLKVFADNGVLSTIQTVTTCQMIVMSIAGRQSWYEMRQVSRSDGGSHFIGMTGYHIGDPLVNDNQ